MGIVTTTEDVLNCSLLWQFQHFLIVVDHNRFEHKILSIQLATAIETFPKLIRRSQRRCGSEDYKDPPSEVPIMIDWDWYRTLKSHTSLAYNATRCCEQNSALFTSRFFRPRPSRSNSDTCIAGSRAFSTSLAFARITSVDIAAFEWIETTKYPDHFHTYETWRYMLKSHFGVRHLHHHLFYSFSNVELNPVGSSYSE